MLRITCVVLVLAIIAMVSSQSFNKRRFTKAVIKASGNRKLRAGGDNLFRDADGMAESCRTSDVDKLGGISYSEPGDSIDDVLTFASKLGSSDELANAKKVACDGYECPDGAIIGVCAYRA